MVVVLLIVAVIFAIIFVAGYISYQKLKHRSTETANFTFIDLQEPSRFQRAKMVLMNAKERFGRRSQRKRVGLVQPRDGEVSDVESFYGSLTHFPDHDTL